MCFPEGAEIDVEDTTRLYYHINNLPNPEWGITRSTGNNFTWDFEANDFEVFT